MALRYGLIGSGMMGQEHIRNIQLLDDCVITAIADPDEAMRNQTMQILGDETKAYGDYHEMLTANLCDACVVASPNDSHHAIMLDLLTTDWPILCEKPLCINTAQCRELIDKASNRAAPVWVAMEYRYMPSIRYLLEVLAAGRVGTPRMISIREHRFPFLHKVADWNRFSHRSGGTMVEKCCHFWDLMRLALQSDPVRVYASAAMDVNHLDERYDGQIPDMIDNAYVVVDFANGTRGMLDLCMFAEGSYWQEVVSVTGEKARVDAMVPGPARFSKDGKERDAQVEISLRSSKEVIRQIVHVDEKILRAGDHHGSTFFQHQRFYNLVRSGVGEVEVSLEDGLWGVRVGEAAEESARSGKPVEL